MDDGRFDAMVRELSAGAPRRRVLAGLLASIPIALVGHDATAKRKRKNKKKSKKGNSFCGKCAGKPCGAPGCPEGCLTCSGSGPRSCFQGECLCYGGGIVDRSRCGPDCEPCPTGRSCEFDVCICPGEECNGACCPPGQFCDRGQCACFAGETCGDACCTGNDVCDGQGQCVCQPACAGKACGADGCGDVCGTCDQGDTCTPQGQCCTPDCEGKSPCASDSCGGTCGTCQNGACFSGQCLCPFPVVRTPACNPGFCPTCSPGVCCPTNQTCLNGACGACPEAPDACEIEQEYFCGRTSARFPFCYCVTSIDEDTTCTSVFVDFFQSRDCISDADCEMLVDIGGAELICAHAPCLGRDLNNSSITKVCMNKGCQDLNFLRSAPRVGRDASSIRQLSLRSAR
jgi:hypothetical protein